MSIIRREIPIIITVLMAGIMLVDYHVVAPQISLIANDIRSGVVVIAGFAIGLGVINLSKIHFINIKRRKKGWYSSVVIIGSMFITFILGLTPPLLTFPAFTYIFDNVVLPLDATVYSMVSFFIVMGAYRAFRLKGFYGTAFAIPGLLMMLAVIPVFESVWSGFPEIGSWLLNVLNVGALRGITIATAIGLLALFARILIGKETGYLGAKE